MACDGLFDSVALTTDFIKHPVKFMTEEMSYTLKPGSQDVPRILNSIAPCDTTGHSLKGKVAQKRLPQLTESDILAKSPLGPHELQTVHLRILRDARWQNRSRGHPGGECHNFKINDIKAMELGSLKLNKGGDHIGTPYYRVCASFTKGARSCDSDWLANEKATKWIAENKGLVKEIGTLKTVDFPLPFPVYEVLPNRGFKRLAGIDNKVWADVGIPDFIRPFETWTNVAKEAFAKAKLPALNPPGCWPTIYAAQKETVTGGWDYCKGRWWEDPSKIPPCTKCVPGKTPCKLNPPKSKDHPDSNLPDPKLPDDPSNANGDYILPKCDPKTNPTCPIMGIGIPGSHNPDDWWDGKPTVVIPDLPKNYDPRTFFEWPEWYTPYWCGLNIFTSLLGYYYNRPFYAFAGLILSLSAPLIYNEIGAAIIESYYALDLDQTKLFDVGASGIYLLIIGSGLLGTFVLTSISRSLSSEVAGYAFLLGLIGTLASILFYAIYSGDLLNFVKEAAKNNAKNLGPFGGIVGLLGDFF